LQIFFKDAVSSIQAQASPLLTPKRYFDNVNKLHDLGIEKNHKENNEKK